MFGDFDQYILGYFLGSFLVIMKVGIFKLMNMLVEQVKIKKFLVFGNFGLCDLRFRNMAKLRD